MAAGKTLVHAKDILGLNGGVDVDRGITVVVAGFGLETSRDLRLCTPGDAFWLRWITEEAER